jgi:hypothetical protein
MVVANPVAVVAHLTAVGEHHAAVVAVHPTVAAVAVENTVAAVIAKPFAMQTKGRLPRNRPLVLHLPSLHRVIRSLSSLHAPPFTNSNFAV